MTASGLDSIERSAARPLLMFAFYFPPFGQSTGRQRTLSFVRHLPAFGWRPVVITARESAYPAIDARTSSEVPPGAEVIRAWGVDIVRLASFRGAYPRWIATPDRFNTWAIGAIQTGLAAARAYKPHALWATFPVPSALLAAVAVHRATGIPLVADLRDPLVYETWPTNTWERAVYAWIERRVVRAAAAVVVTTRSACTMYRDRYRELPPERFQVIANGVEDELPTQATTPTKGGPITLVHSGLMESPDRDPGAFFGALRLLANRGELPPQGLRVVLRASGREAAYAELARAQGVESLIDLAPAIARDQALAEQANATGLLVFQGPQCNRQIPAKAYEYLASRRPIIALIHKDGDTYALLRNEWGVPYVADMNSPEEIAGTLTRFFADVHAGQAYVPPHALIDRYSRRARANDLAQLLETVAVVTSQTSTPKPSFHR